MGVDELPMPDVTVPVVLELSSSQVVLEDVELRSPGFSKPMRRAYKYVQTPEHVPGMGDAMPDP